MSNWPTIHDGAVDALYTLQANTKGVALPGGATDVKGAWVELKTSTPRDYAGILVEPQWGHVNRQHLIDVGIGAAGSEVVIVPDVYTSALTTATKAMKCVFFPIAIKAGSRVAMRQATNSFAGATLLVGLHGVAQSFLGFVGGAKVIAMGAVVFNSKGTPVDPGAVADTKGVWVELAASVGSDLATITMIWSTNVNTIPSNARFAYDLAIGASGSEQIIIPDGLVTSGGGGRNVFPASLTIPVTVKKGSRIAARLQSDITDATDRVLDVVAYGSVV